MDGGPSEGFAFDHATYTNTRAFVLSERNKNFFRAERKSTSDVTPDVTSGVQTAPVVEGIGSEHVDLHYDLARQIWPLSLVMQAMTEENEDNVHRVIKLLYAVSGQKDVPPKLEAPRLFSERLTGPESDSGKYGSNGSFLRPSSSKRERARQFMNAQNAKQRFVDVNC